MDGKGSLPQVSSSFDNMDPDTLFYRASAMGAKSLGKLLEGPVQEDVVFPWILVTGFYTWVCRWQVHLNVNLLVCKTGRWKPSTQLVVRINWDNTCERRESYFNMKAYSDDLEKSQESGSQDNAAARRHPLQPCLGPASQGSHLIGLGRVLSIWSFWKAPQVIGHAVRAASSS